MMLSRRLALGAAVATLAAPHAARAQSRRFKVGHNNSTDSVLHAAATGFDAALQAASGGRYGLEIVPNSALGSEAEMLKAVSEGTLDATIAPVGTTAALAREVGLLETPYLFRDAAQARGALDGALGQHCAALLRDKGLSVGAWCEVGFRHITANRPVRDPAALRGLKIRVPISEAIMESFRAMGAAADALPFPQLPEALRTGRFEAQENPVNIIVAAQLHRFQSHLSLTGHVYTPAALAMSTEVLEELPQADRAMVLAAMPAGAAASRQLADRMESAGLDQLRAAGMTVVTDVDGAAMRAATAPARERLSAVFGAESVRRMTGLVS
ncbi:TRAP transporter substrate-binding protein [Falsiroseomonas ponticola]|jgi:tripartite ATP-independent transporter DctP family solute receptor|uniref:TRAP transporter substrate-binding protein n=1 Tax=Falsiroseomonas ponticola TaxID=2786951 RepID=UPI0019349410|nr:TRAP transporter substrate-binding protein [Roseomonas ponticola]